MMNLTCRRSALCAGLFAVAVSLSACASLAPGTLAKGTPIAQARHMVFPPTGEYTLPGGGTRLEFAQGSFGKQTFMLDFDANGLLVSNQQVLDPANFAEIKPGMSQGDVRVRLGRPAEVFGAGWQQKIHVWNYRFFGGDCVWFQVSIGDATGQVTQAGIGSDPACDVGSRRW